MAKEIWRSNEPVTKHRPASSGAAPSPRARADPWSDGHRGSGPNWLLWGGIALVAIILFIFLVRPAWVGYQTYQAMQESGVPEEYALEMASLQARTEAAEAQAAQATAAAQAARSDQSQAASDRDALKAQCDQDLASFQADSASKAAALDSCEAALEMQEPALADAARRICCMQRVDNPAISGYEIQDSHISCVTEGGEGISC